MLFSATVWNECDGMRRKIFYFSFVVFSRWFCPGDFLKERMDVGSEPIGKVHLPEFHFVSKFKTENSFHEIGNFIDWNIESIQTIRLVIDIRDVCSHVKAKLNRMNSFRSIQLLLKSLNFKVSRMKLQSARPRKKHSQWWFCKILAVHSFLC